MRHRTKDGNITSRLVNADKLFSSITATRCPYPWP